MSAPMTGSFSDFLHQYGDSAYRMAFQLTGGREADARDLVQDAFLKIWKHWNDEEPVSLKAWMFRLMRNLYIDGLRKKGRRPALSLDAPAPDSETGWEQNLPDGALLIDQRLERDDLRHEVSKALAQLDVDYRTAIVLCDMEGMAYDEIAQIMNCPIGTVRSRIHRARGMMRDLLRSPFAPASAESQGMTVPLRSGFRFASAGATGDLKLKEPISLNWSRTNTLRSKSPVAAGTRSGPSGGGGPQ